MLESKIILSADSTCDLSAELCQRYSIHINPFHVILEGKTYADGVDLTPAQIMEVYASKKILPKTAAINAMEYADYFRQWTDQGYEVIHFTIGSGISTTYNNCCLAAKEVPGVYPVDSCNLSTGIALLIIEAAERIAAGLPAAQIAEEVRALTGHVNASFIIDTLEFLYKGGRCSALQMLGANVLQLKPCIEVSTADGTMGVGKKYRGSLEKALLQYVQDRLAGRTDIKTDRVFITHSPMSKERVEMVREALENLHLFKEIHETDAGCTIASHCGANTLGVLFMTK